MADPWVVTYDLASDSSTIRSIQKATQTTEGFGIEPDVALFGSEEWWQAIEAGVIPRVTREGVISRLYMTGHNDWPEFEIDCDGRKSSWTQEGIAEHYRVGRRVKIEYVVQRLRGGHGGTDVVLKILVARDDDG